MYRVALRITPEQLRAVAAQLYAELLRGGYTQVCEFHYLQHDLDGRPYADPLALSWALADAAADAGIGLTMLPVLYERAGFAQPALRDDQRRFATDAEAVLALHRGLQRSGRPLLNAGVAIHSLRAAAPAVDRSSWSTAWATCRSTSTWPSRPPRSTTACRPPGSGRSNGWPATRRWTRAGSWCMPRTPRRAEIDAVARSGAGVVICPSTEGNLGDGLADLPGWLQAGVPMAIGSDSHVTRAWPEELRWLEYGQRLLHRQRNVSAAPAEGEPATAARLFERALARRRHGRGLQVAGG